MFAGETSLRITQQTVINASHNAASLDWVCIQFVSCSERNELMEAKTEVLLLYGFPKNVSGFPALARYFVGEIRQQKWIYF